MGNNNYLLLVGSVLLSVLVGGWIGSSFNVNIASNNIQEGRELKTFQPIAKEVVYEKEVHGKGNCWFEEYSVLPPGYSYTVSSEGRFSYINPSGERDKRFVEVDWCQMSSWAWANYRNSLNKVIEERETW